MMTYTTEIRKLYRSRRQKMIAGVCGGLAEFLGVDVTLIRLLWLVAALINGTGVVAYLICLMLMKENPDPTTESAAPSAMYRPEMVAGVAFIILGTAFMLRNLTGLDWWLPWHWHHFLHISIRDIWPLILIVLGAGILLRSFKTPAIVSTSEQEHGQVRMLRCKRDRMLSGVCGGIAAFAKIDSTVVRIVWAFTSIYVNVLAGILCYILMIVLVPEE
jgi:phage shock protein C